MIDRFTHIHEDAYYEVGNYSVAGSFLFANEKDLNKMKSKIDDYFDGLCYVICYGFSHEEYRMIIKMRSRIEIEQYCMKRYPKIIKKQGFIPHTAYIFARAMADLQSGYAKWLNHKYDRTGAVMAGRYFRVLIESEEELDQRIADINKTTLCFQKAMVWRYKSKMGFRIRGLGTYSSSKHDYNPKSGLRSSLKVIKIKGLIYVRGHFTNLPPKRIIWQNQAQKFKNLVGFILLGSK